MTITYIDVIGLSIVICSCYSLSMILHKLWYEMAKEKFPNMNMYVRFWLVILLCPFLFFTIVPCFLFKEIFTFFIDWLEDMWEDNFIRRYINRVDDEADQIIKKGKSYQRYD